MSERGKWKWDPHSRQLVKYSEPARATTHFIHTDYMPPTMNHSDGRVYESKSAFHAATKRAGDISREGDISIRHKEEWDGPDEEEMRAEVEKAYYQVRDGMAPLSELDKERCKIVNRQLKDKFGL